MTEKTILNVYKIQGFLGLLCSGALLFLTSSKEAFAFLAGVIVITLNFYMLATVWKRFFDKKPVATTALLIITKYAVLGILIYAFVNNVNIKLVPFFAGITTIIGAFLIVGLQTYLKEKKQ